MYIKNHIVDIIIICSNKNSCIDHSEFLIAILLLLWGTAGLKESFFVVFGKRSCRSARLTAFNSCFPSLRPLACNVDPFSDIWYWHLLFFVLGIWDLSIFAKTPLQDLDTLGFSFPGTADNLFSLLHKAFPPFKW